LYGYRVFWKYLYSKNNNNNNNQITVNILNSRVSKVFFQDNYNNTPVQPKATNIPVSRVQHDHYETPLPGQQTIIHGL